MSREFCQFRVAQISQRRMVVDIAAHPPVTASSDKDCTVLTGQQALDTTCQNPDMGHFTCPVSPLCGQQSNETTLG